MDLKLSYKNAERILEVEDGEVPYLRYPLLSDTGIVKHGFSTRLGGVSEGCYASMNLSFTRGDREEDVRENFCRIADAIGVRCEDMVFSQQTHTSNVRVVTEADRGMGINTTACVAGCGRSRDGCSGDLSCDILCRLCAAFFRGSGEKGDRAESFRMEGNGCEDRERDGQEDAGSLRMRPGRYSGSRRTIDLSGLLRSERGSDPAVSRAFFGERLGILVL